MSEQTTSRWWWTQRATWRFRLRVAWLVLTGRTAFVFLHRTYEGLWRATVDFYGPPAAPPARSTGEDR